MFFGGEKTHINVYIASFLKQELLLIARPCTDSKISFETGVFYSSVT